MLRLLPIVSESQTFINPIAISYTATLVPYKYSLQLWNSASLINVCHITTESKSLITITLSQFVLILIQKHCTGFCEVDKRGNFRKLLFNYYYLLLILILLLLFNYYLINRENSVWMTLLC